MKLTRTDVQNIIPQHAGEIQRLMSRGYEVFYASESPYRPIDGLWIVYEFINVVKDDNMVSYSRGEHGKGDSKILDDIKDMDWEVHRYEKRNCSRKRHGARSTAKRI